MYNSIDNIYIIFYYYIYKKMMIKFNQYSYTNDEGIQNI